MDYEKRLWALAKVKETGLGPTILEANLKFLKRDPSCAAKNYDRDPEFFLYVNKIGRLEQEKKNELGAICCQARFTIGLFDTKDRKLVLPTKAWLDALGISHVD